MLENNKLIKLSNNFDKLIYTDTNLKKYFNEYNLESFKIINELSNKLNEDYFEVPYYIKNTIWGSEKIYYPFTDKLFKIINTSKNQTSIQLHPFKCEIWYPLKKCKIYDSEKWIDVEEDNIIIIKNHSIHCMGKDGMVFENQDNNLFDNHETLRIWDKCGRKTDNINDIYINTMPSLKNKVKVLPYKTPKYKNKKNLFIFILNGKASIKKNNNIIKLKSGCLYYINMNQVDDILIEGRVFIDNARFYTF